MSQYEYFAILTVIFVLAYTSKIWLKIKLFYSLRELIVFYAIVFLITVSWDSFAIYRGHWMYPGSGILGIRVGLIPIEDFFFALVVSFAVLVVYKMVTKKG